MDQRERALDLLASWTPGNRARMLARTGKQPKGSTGYVPLVTYIDRFIREHPECASFRAALLAEAKHRPPCCDHVQVRADEWDKGAKNGEKCLKTMPRSHD